MILIQFFFSNPSFSKTHNSHLPSCVRSHISNRKDFHHKTKLWNLRLDHFSENRTNNFLNFVKEVMSFA